MVTDIGAKIRAYRDERGWSQYRLAKESGISHSFISTLERNEKLPTIATLERLCNAFDITLEAFFAAEVTSQPPTPTEPLIEASRHLKPHQRGLLTRLLTSLDPQSNEASPSRVFQIDREFYFAAVVNGLAHALASGEQDKRLIERVGLYAGQLFEQIYRNEWQITRPLTIREFADLILDVKRRVHGDYNLVSIDESKVVLANRACPFNDWIDNTPSLCELTTSVFGGIAARNFGYAKVILHERIAAGDAGCHVTVYVQPNAEAQAASGIEYSAV